MLITLWCTTLSLVLIYLLERYACRITTQPLAVWQRWLIPLPVILIVGANLDPSHLMWMGADPIASIDALGSAIYHSHAKDTFINSAVCATTSRLENGSLMDIPARAWSYITLGYGNDESWWRAFCYRLRMVGYDGWLSIEHEDVMLSRIEGVKKSVELLKNVAPSEASDYKPQEM